MAEILITGMDLSEDRQIIITKDGKVLATDWRGISMPTEATARELPHHGDLKDRGDLYERLYSLRTFPYWDYSTIGDKVIESAPTIVEATK